MRDGQEIGSRIGFAEVAIYCHDLGKITELKMSGSGSISGFE
ncbi:MAG: hypothetical protein CLLPBCKN_000183 [Chroococcidiopsis cubana SAG 39.79]|jgi:hypothetical protein|nr:hypothetical protein [Chroococcidiopsis cubana SAG 39.79]